MTPALDRLRERTQSVIDADVALERQAAAQRQPEPYLEYALGNTRVIRIRYELCRGRPALPYGLADGRTVVIDLISTPAEVAEAHAAWRAL